jgi:3-phosphoshikimate 1-carboxyvinyltransferase
VSIERSGGGADGLSVRIEGRGLHGLRPPSGTLDAGNSGSTIRMLAGVLAGHPFSASMTGDASLRQRPMRRIIQPPERMGAPLDSAARRPPLTIHGTRALQGPAFQPEVPSAQVKSAVLLAGLHAEGTTDVLERIATRDHTERALEAFGVEVRRAGSAVSVSGGGRLAGCTLDVPGDVSSAAFWMVAAAARPGSEVVVTGVGLNPTRTGIVEVLRRMGADVIVEEQSVAGGEPVGTLTVRHRDLVPARIDPDEVPGVIDELPVLAALATYGGGLHVSGAQELRVKESDRISALAEGLRRMGAEIVEAPDGFTVVGHGRLHGAEVDARHDHRLAMAFAIAALGASGPTTVLDAGAAAVSYPEFFTVLDSLRA